MESMTLRMSSDLTARLHILAMEYTVPADVLVNVAVRRLLDDVALLRALRMGEITLEDFSAPDA